MIASLKKDIKDGAISQKDANKVLDSINKEIETLEWELFNMEQKERAALFPNEWIYLGEIKEFLYNSQNI